MGTSQSILAPPSAARMPASIQCLGTCSSYRDATAGCKLNSMPTTCLRHPGSCRTPVSSLTNHMLPWIMHAICHLSQHNTACTAGAHARAKLHAGRHSHLTGAWTSPRHQTVTHCQDIAEHVALNVHGTTSAATVPRPVIAAQKLMNFSEAITSFDWGNLSWALAQKRGDSTHEFARSVSLP